MPPETRKYTRNKAPPPAPTSAPAMATFMTESVEAEEDGDEMTDDGVTYFVDEEGRYYYQPNPTESDIVALDTETGAAQEVQPQPMEDMIVPDVDGSFTQTVTLVPSENTNGEVSYVLVVADENKDLVNLNIKMDTDVGQEEKQDGAGDVYTFEDDEEEEGSAAASDDETAPLGRQRTRHKSRSIFTCNFCSYNSHRRYLLLRHMKSHSEDRPYKCTVCERGFKTQASLLNHVNMHNGIKPHICKYCKSTFTTSGELVRHVRYKHTHEKPHKCNECDYASVELSKLRRHVRCHTGERPYQCPHCTYASPDTFKLKRHLRTHTGEKPYKCDMCTMCFTQSNSLKAHKLIHNVSEKPVFACELCPAKCGRKTDLRIHVQKLHTSEQPLKCRRCGKSFPDRYSCKVHNKTHEGEKCFKCDLCPYASTTLRHLKSHILKHTDEKPFSCDQCDQTFRQKQLLRRHQNLYHNPDYVPRPPKEKTHTCHECHRTFAHKGNLMRHLAIHDPESGHHERALALKLGRQKKVKYIDANANKHPFLSEIKTEGENSEMVKVGVSNSLKRGELVTVSDGDGQQYVVLEVIQLEDGTEQQVAVVAPDFLQGEEIEEEEIDEYGDEEILEDEEENEEEKKNNQKQLRLQEATERSIKLEKEVDTCFGFDVSDGEEGETEVETLVEIAEEDDEEEMELDEEAGSSNGLPGKDDAAVPTHLPQLLFAEDEEDDEEQQVVYELV